MNRLKTTDIVVLIENYPVKFEAIYLCLTPLTTRELPTRGEATNVGIIVM